MGQEQEDRILARYINHKQKNGNSDISMQKAGFLIDKELGWCVHHQMQWLITALRDRVYRNKDRCFFLG